MSLKTRISKLYKEADEKALSSPRCFLCYRDDENNHVVIENSGLNFDGTREEFETLSNQRQFKNDLFVLINFGLYGSAS